MSLKNTLAHPTHYNPSASQRGWLVVAALLGLTAVALGAVASHALADPLAARAVERASLYQLIHAVVLLFAAGLTGYLALGARCFLLVGIVLFCGSIELKYLFSVTNASAFAPTGGVCLMLGWLLLGASALRRGKPNN